jgi:hypothetical protein
MAKAGNLKKKNKKKQKKRQHPKKHSTLFDLQAFKAETIWFPSDFPWYHRTTG